jgi:hypothetical protein
MTPTDRRGFTEACAYRNNPQIFGHRNLQREKKYGQGYISEQPVEFKLVLLLEIMFHFGTLQKPIRLVICGSENGMIFGRSVERCFFQNFSKMAFRFHKKYT